MHCNYIFRLFETEMSLFIKNENIRLCKKTEN